MIKEDISSKVPLRAYFLLALAPLFWAGNWVVARGVHADIPASGLNFWRWTLAFLILAPFCTHRVIRQWDQIKANWRVIAVLGVVGAGLFQFIVYQGLHYTSAINGVIFNATLGFFVIPISWMLLGEKITRRQGMGLLFSFLGMLVIVGKGNPAFIFSLEFGIGDVIVLAAMPLWALYTVILKKWPMDVDNLALLMILSAIGVAVMSPIYLADYVFTGNQVEFTPGNIKAILYVGIFPAVVAFYCWNEGVGLASPNVAALLYYLMPAYGMILAYVFLGEDLHIFQLAGLFLILTGVYLSISKGRTQSQGASNSA